MEQNFHYHATYTAAVAAGFSPGDATVIARAAQYVDECNGVTVQGTGTLLWKNLLDTIPGFNKSIQEVLHIWPVFHFLPGNYNAIQPYVDPQISSSSKPHLQLAPQLICGSESPLTAQLVAHTQTDFGNTQTSETQRLQRIGITMHVLADTFAHQGFAGIPLSAINEVWDVKRAEPGGDLAAKRYMPLRYSPGLTASSFGYLGHGRIGHLTDQPGDTFLYRAAWKNAARDNWVSRYNPLEFYCAYLQMTEAMAYISGNTTQFSNYIDRGQLLDQRGPRWAATRPFLAAMEAAGTDQGFPEAWYAVLPAIQRPQPYTPYDSVTEAGLIRSFTAAAQAHQAVVLGNCPALVSYLALFS